MKKLPLTSNITALLDSAMKTQGFTPQQTEPECARCHELVSVRNDCEWEPGMVCDECAPEVIREQELEIEDLCAELEKEATENDNLHAENVEFRKVVDNLRPVKTFETECQALERENARLREDVGEVLREIKSWMPFAPYVNGCGDASMWSCNDGEWIYKDEVLEALSAVLAGKENDD